MNVEAIAAARAGPLRAERRIAVGRIYHVVHRAADQRPDAPGRPGINPLGFSTTYTIDDAGFAELKRVSDRLGLTQERVHHRAQFFSAKEAPDDASDSLSFLGGQFRRGDAFQISTKVSREDAEANLRSVLCRAVSVSSVHRRRCAGNLGEVLHLTQLETIPEQNHALAHELLRQVVSLQQAIVGMRSALFEDTEHIRDGRRILQCHKADRKPVPLVAQRESVLEAEPAVASDRSDVREQQQQILTRRIGLDRLPVVEVRHAWTEQQRRSGAFTLDSPGVDHRQAGGHDFGYNIVVAREQIGDGCHDDGMMRPAAVVEQHPLREDSETVSVFRSVDRIVILAKTAHADEV